MFTISNVGIFTAFMAGAVSFLSPCVLPLVPGYVSYVAGFSDSTSTSVLPSPRLRAIGMSTFFVLGFSTVFVALGASVTGLSRLIFTYRQEANVIGGILVIGFGLLATQIIRVPGLERDIRVHPALQAGGPVPAYVLGLAFGFGWTPCIGPVLGAILTVSAVSASAAEGVALLSIYSLGLGVPFLLSALFMDRIAVFLRRMRHAGSILQFGAGGLMVAMGLAMITGRLSELGFWLLYQFPVLSKIG